MTYRQTTRRTQREGRQVRQPCLDCGTPTDARRCPRCEREFNAERNKRFALRRAAEGGRPGYSNAYRRAARVVRATATRCWICGKGPKPHDPWQADHVVPLAVDPNSTQLAPAHRSCNIARANKARARDTEQNPARATRNTRTPQRRPRSNRDEPPRGPGVDQ